VLLQVKGRKLLADDSSQQKGPSYGDLFLQSYEKCKGSSALNPMHLEFLSSPLQNSFLVFTIRHEERLAQDGSIPAGKARFA